MMTRSARITLGKIAALIAAPVVIFAFSSGPPAAHTGAPGEQTCTQCHTGTTLNGGGGSVTIAFADGSTSYAAGSTKRVRVTVTDSVARAYGFQASPRLSGDATKPAGRLVGAANLLVLCSNDVERPSAGCPAASPLEYIEHSSPGSTGTFEFDWQAPAAGTGSVTFYVAANAANGNRSNSGDHIYNSSATFTEAVTTSNKPALGDGGVVNAAGSGRGITPGSWVSIYGTNLASAVTPWDAFIVNGNFPTVINGVSVTIDGKPAFLNFISPNQINVQAPDTASRGPVQVVVTTPDGASNTVSAQMSDIAPGLFTYPGGGKKYASATRSDQRLYYGDPAFLPGVNARRAAPGDVVELWGTGFGPTKAARPIGSVVTQASETTSPVTVRVGTQDVPAAFAGLVGAGLYQINFTVPDLPDGEYSISATINGITTQSDAVFLIRRQ